MTADRSVTTPKSPRLGRRMAALVPASLALAAGLLLAASPALAQTSLTRVQEFSYDPTTALLTQQVSEPDNAAITLTTTFTYDGFGNQLTSTVSGPDIASRTTSATYTTDGRFPVSASNALSHSDIRVTDPRFGAVTSLTGPNGLETTWEYDGFGRKTKELRADGTETRWTYELCDTQCPAGAVYLVSSQEFDALGSPSSAKAIDYLDKLNRVFRSESEGFDGTPVFVDTVYNARGEVEKVSKPYFQGTAPEAILWTTFTYDIVGRRIAVTLPDGGGEATEFDGLTTRLENALDQESIRVENAIGELVSATDNLGNVTTYTYDSFGNLLETEAEGVVTAMTYDIRGLKVAMDDPDMGTWSYAYDALGQLVSQTDAKSQTVTMAYDLLGRMVTRTEAEGTTTWTYDTATMGLGKIAGVSAPGIAYAEAITYDSFGRPSTASLTFEGETYDTQTLYDTAGRADTLVYPSGFEVRSHFTANGHLAAVTDQLSTVTYWQADTVNAEGQVTAETLGNGVTTARVYDPATSRIDAILTTSGATTVQDLGFDFDTLGNLTARRDLLQDREEAFTYDGLNRLLSTTLADTATLATLNATTYAYDSLGNIQTKSDVAGTYVYGLAGAGPHAVSQIGSKIYSYDANGAMVSGDGKTTAWSSFNKPQVITDTLTLNESLFVYGPSRARVKHRETDGGLITNIFYVGSHYERKTRSGDDDEMVHYIRAGGATVAIYTEYRDEFDGVTSDKTRYLHRDHLGSIESVTDETGTVSERFSYDAHGKRRETDWTPALVALSGQETPRGFTGHEHLDAVGLIHMNGRVYDPTLGRFLSADPFVQYPETVQGFNRYSYVSNNPLSYTDPSGFMEGAGVRDTPSYDGHDGNTHKDDMEMGRVGTGISAHGIDWDGSARDERLNKAFHRYGLRYDDIFPDWVDPTTKAQNAVKEAFNRNIGYTPAPSWNTSSGLEPYPDFFFGFGFYDPNISVPGFLEAQFQYEPAKPGWETVFIGQLPGRPVGPLASFTLNAEVGMRVRISAHGYPQAPGRMPGVPGGEITMKEIAVHNPGIVGKTAWSAQFSVGVSGPAVTEFTIDALPAPELSFGNQVQPGRLHVQVELTPKASGGFGAEVTVDIHRGGLRNKKDTSQWF